tara:strand:+ start:779 stop:2848 length:2070 start_codon:yes stop_codon:yes gene_type:complete
MINKFFFFVGFVVLFLFSNIGHSIESEWKGIEEAKVRIISPLSTTNMDEEITIGLQYKLKKGWKTYWKSPGAGGFPQEINYNNSQNIKNINIIWPSPKQFSILEFISLGYENEVVFPIKIKLLNKFKETNINFDINFLVCNNICIPGDVSLNLILPANNNAKITQYAQIIEKYISLSPSETIRDSKINIKTSKIYKDKNDIIFELEVHNTEQFNNPRIFIDNDQGLPVVEPLINFNNLKNKLTAKFYYKDISLTNNNIILHVSDLPLVYEKKVKLVYATNNKSNVFTYKIINIILISILGGLILNIMPCVLPVLSMKIFSVIKFSNLEKKQIRIGFLCSSLGIIFSYAILAILLSIVKISGKNIGWGMQFQEPYFLMFISVVLLFFSLNLFGLFEISLPQFFIKSSQLVETKSFYIKNFFTGFFATLMATPCSAPFVGTAITFAFTQQTIIFFSIFIFMGFGMSIPYLIIAIFPSTIKIFPRPGNWMSITRFFLGLLLFGTLIWVGNILQNHFNNIFLLISIIVTVWIIIVLYLYKKNIIHETTIKLILFFSICLFFLLPIFGDFNKFNNNYNDEWIEFSSINIDKLIKDNQIVFVDVTADWCATCQYNKQRIINTESIQETFMINKVVQIKADWTLPNDEINEFLNKYNRYGIPFNIIYGPGFSKGIILPELLTKNDIKDAINLIQNN